MRSIYQVGLICQSGILKLNRRIHEIIAIQKLTKDDKYCIMCSIDGLLQHATLGKGTQNKSSC